MPPNFKLNHSSLIVDPGELQILTKLRSERKLAESSKEGRPGLGILLQLQGLVSGMGARWARRVNVLSLTGIADTSEAQRDVGNRAPILVGRIFRGPGTKAAVTSGTSAGPR